MGAKFALSHIFFMHLVCELFNYFTDFILYIYIYIYISIWILSIESICVLVYDFIYIYILCFFCLHSHKNELFLKYIEHN